MGRLQPSRSREVRGQKAKAQSIATVIQEAFRLWRKHHLGYDQTKYVVEEAGRKPGKERCSGWTRAEIERLIQATYRNKSKYGSDGGQEPCNARQSYGLSRSHGRECRGDRRAHP